MLAVPTEWHLDPVVVVTNWEQTMGCGTGPPQSSPTEDEHLSGLPHPRRVNPTRVHTPCAWRRGLCLLLNSTGMVKSVAKHGCLVPRLAHTSARQPPLGTRAVFALGARPAGRGAVSCGCCVRSTGGPKVKQRKPCSFVSARREKRFDAFGQEL